MTTQTLTGANECGVVKEEDVTSQLYDKEPGNGKARCHDNR